MRTCPRCGQENPEEARFCLHRGDQGSLEEGIATLARSDDTLRDRTAGLYLPEVDAVAAPR